MLTGLLSHHPKFKKKIKSLFFSGVYYLVPTPLKMATVSVAEEVYAISGICNITPWPNSLINMTTLGVRICIHLIFGYNSNEILLRRRMRRLCHRCRGFIKDSVFGCLQIQRKIDDSSRCIIRRLL